MAMSIHRTLCVLVSPENFTPRDVPSQQIRKLLLRADFLSPPLFFLKISLLEMLIAFGNEHLKMTYRPPLLSSGFLKLFRLILLLDSVRVDF